MTTEARNAALVANLKEAADLETVWTDPEHLWDYARSFRALLGEAWKALEEADARYATHLKAVERWLGELGVTIGAIDPGCEGVHVEELLRLIMAKARADREKLGG